MNLTRAVLVFVFLSVTLYLSTIDSCEIYKFVASEIKNQALEGHVIKTIVHSLVPLCWNDCVWMSWCMSINVRPTNHGTVECDLNNSSKKANPGSLVTRQGSQYHEMKGVDDRHCKTNECKRKEDLGDGWFRYGKAAIKLFQELKNWTDARLFCQSLGGDLLSISSSHENDFVYDVFVKKLNLTYGERERKFPDVHWKLNGYEPGVSFHGTSGGAKFLSHEGEKALYVSGTGGYAKVDAVPFNLEGFTITLWLKNHLNTTAGYPSAFTGISSDGYLMIYTIAKICIACKVKPATPATMDQGNCGCPQNVWCHFSFIWNKTESLYGLLINGKKFGNFSATSLGIIPTEFVFGSSKLHDAFNHFHGYIKHFMLFHKSLSLHEAQTAMHWHEHAQGVWIGLNDQANKNAFRWSDGTPVSQFMPLPAYNPQPALSGRECVTMRSNRMWLDKHCEEKKPFMCEKPAA